MLQTLVDLDRTATILSLDGVGVFDFVSHYSMLKGLLTMEGGDRVLPFVRLFYGNPSTFLWGNDFGGVHSVLQGEGGEQGDPLMPMLFSLGQHAALMAVAARWRDGERLFAFLDDLCIITSHNILREENVVSHKNQGKHAFGTVAGSCLTGATFLEQVARVVDPTARVWRGNHEDRVESQGIIVLGTPVGRTQQFTPESS